MVSVLGLKLRMTISRSQLLWQGVCKNEISLMSLNYFLIILSEIELKYRYVSTF